MRVVDGIEVRLLHQHRHRPERLVLLVQHVASHVAHNRSVQRDLVNVAVVVDVVEDVARAVGEGQCVAIDQRHPHVFQLDGIVHYHGRRGEATRADLRVVVLNVHRYLDAVVAHAAVRDLSSTVPANATT